MGAPNLVVLAFIPLFPALGYAGLAHRNNLRIALGIDPYLLNEEKDFHELDAEEQVA